MTAITYGAAPEKVAVTTSLLAEHGAHGRILVVGCGDGREAGIIARTLGVEVVGVDVGDEFAFDHAGAAPATLMTMDAQRLDFPGDSFDAIYSFHALEHIPDPEAALREMRRVLRPGGVYLVGTPNKQRLVGYVGSAVPLRMKLRWNWNDWRKRARREWSNGQGAHAGFTAAELLAMCGRHFDRAPQDVSDDYYRKLYASRRGLIDSLAKSGLRRWAYPAVYVASA